MNCGVWLNKERKKERMFLWLEAREHLLFSDFKCTAYFSFYHIIYLLSLKYGNDLKRSMHLLNEVNWCHVIIYLHEVSFAQH